MIALLRSFFLVVFLLNSHYPCLCLAVLAVLLRDGGNFVVRLRMMVEQVIVPAIIFSFIVSIRGGPTKSLLALHNGRLL
jgi:hypothetical protein